MRIDLQDVYRANPKAFIAAAVVVGAGFIALLVAGISGTSGSTPATRAHTSTVVTSTGTTTQPSGVTTPDPNYYPSYTTSVPSSAVDQQLAALMAPDGPTIAAVEAVNPPSPAWTTAYPKLVASSTKSDQAYSVAFLQELLDRNYRKQSREDLARWVEAEAAAEMLPGVPARAGDQLLYVKLLVPGVLSEPPGPVPSAAEWAALANAGVIQHVYGLFVNPDASWESAVSRGLTSADPLLGVDDVTGVIATTSRAKTTTKHFSVKLMLGSALHHPGYGAVEFEQWAAN